MKMGRGRTKIGPTVKTDTHKSYKRRNRNYADLFFFDSLLQFVCWNCETLIALQFLCSQLVLLPLLLLRYCGRVMEKEGKSDKGCSRGDKQTDLMLQWGNRKRLRCVKVKKDQNSSANQSSSHDSAGKKKITFRVDRRIPPADKEYASPQPPCLNKSSTLPMNSWKSSVASPEKEDRYYTTRGSMGLDENGKVLIDQYVKEERGVVWPKLYVTLSSKEKEADFLAMKGCKLPQRPKKRAKLIQRSVLLVSPGGWLADLCKERYKVREKNAAKKRPRGLKAMGSMESDSE